MAQSLLVNTFFTVVVVFAVGLPSLHAKPLRVGVVRDGVAADGHDPEMTRFLTLLKKELAQLATNREIIELDENHRFSGKVTLPTIRDAFDLAMTSANVDIVLTAGVISGQIAAQSKKLRKPVVVPFVIDRGMQGFPHSDSGSGSGRKNLSYLEWPWSLSRDLEVFSSVVGRKDFVFVLDQKLVVAFPVLSKAVKRQAAVQGFSVEVIGVKNLEHAKERLRDRSEAVYLGPIFGISPQEESSFFTWLQDQKLGSYSLLGERQVRGGALVGRRPESIEQQIARRVALSIIRIAEGERAADLSTALRFPESIMVNMETARAIDVSPSWSVLTEAELIDLQRTDVKRTLSLESAIEEALNGNVNIKAAKASLAAARGQLRSARSNLLPTVTATTVARVIDKNGAAQSFGQAPEFLWNGELSAKQVLFAEPALAGWTATQKQVEGQNHQLKITRLDIVQQVAVSYLNVVRSKTIERIRRQNLKVTRANLQMAQVRVDAGASSQADIYRWQSQIARDQQTLIGASTQRNIAELELRRLLHWPTEEPFQTNDELVGDGALAHTKGIDKFINAPKSFRTFREFLLDETIARSPEIKQLDAALAAQKRLLLSSKRRPYMPTIAASGNVTQRFHQAGAGTEAPPGQNQPNDTGWFIGLSATIPIYDGGDRYAAVEQNSAEVTRLLRQREFTVDSLRQLTATRAHQMGNSYAGITLSGRAAKAAAKNFELSASSYKQGALPIISLIDAQNVWIQADLLAADSAYQFLIDWINLQRAVGMFAYLTSDEQRRELIRRISEYQAAQH